jgi:WbqC-like protein family.
MQPYFLPYIGYWQLIAAVDVFVIYDNIKYTKKGWINRNRLLRKGAPAVFSLPLRAASDDLDVRDREIAPEFRGKTLLAQVRGAYLRAPQFEPTFALLERILVTGERNLFLFLERSIRLTCEHLGIGTEIRRSSDVSADRDLRGQDRVLAICEAVGTDVYVNAIGGVELYSAEAFAARGMELRFIRSRPLEYQQPGAPFVPNLSILDVLMFNSLSAVREAACTGFDLVGAAETA